MASLRHRHASRRPAGGRILITGWFSFADGEATAGDLEAAAASAAWLDRRGFEADVAYSPAFGEERTLAALDPADYATLLFVCGPLAGVPVEQLVGRFPHALRIALGVSVVSGGLEAAFDVVLSRDGDGAGWPDLSMALGASPWPVAALVRANPQPEYGARARHADVHAALEDYLERAEVAVIDVDTRVDPRRARQRAVGQLDGLLGAADVVVTTRLHGLVLGLRAGTPVVAVDPVEGGAKVSHQARALRWPAVLLPSELDSSSFADCMSFCLGPHAASAVRLARTWADAELEALEGNLVTALGSNRPGAAPAPFSRSR